MSFSLSHYFRLKSLGRAAMPGLIAAGLASAAAAAQPAEIPRIVIFANQAPTEGSRVGSSATVLTGDDLREKGLKDRKSVV